MRKEIGVDDDAHTYQVFDLDTGEEIKDCFMADDETGEYGFFPLDASGHKYMTTDKLDIVRKYAKGNIELRRLPEA